MELEKLISYTEGRQVVTDRDVEEICTEQVTGRIFDMVAAIAGRRTRQAMDLYEDLLMAGGMGWEGIASQLKLQPFVVGKIMPQARSFTREQILSYVDLCVDAEEAVKTGRLGERLAVELLIAKNY